MIINPKTIKTCVTERRMIRNALMREQKRQQQRLSRSKNIRVIENCEDEIANRSPWRSRGIRKGHASSNRLR